MCPDHPVTHHRDARCFIEPAHLSAAVFVEAQIDALVGEIARPEIPPPFGHRTEAHARQERPAMEISEVEMIGLEEHLGETGFRKTHNRLHVLLGLDPQGKSDMR